MEQRYREIAASILDLLARLHDHPLDAKELDELRSADFPRGLGLDISDPITRVAVDAMSAVLDELPLSLTSSTADDLARAHADIYVSHALGLNPREGLWVDSGAVLRQGSVLRLRSLYLRHGMKPAEQLGRPDDHLVRQLDFASHLLRSPSATALDVAGFLDGHPLRWLPTFADRLDRHGGAPFYVALAQLTAAALRGIRDALAAEEPAQVRLCG